jgi:hypothetical protein
MFQDWIVFVEPEAFEAAGSPSLALVHVDGKYRGNSPYLRHTSRQPVSCHESTRT